MRFARRSFGKHTGRVKLLSGVESSSLVNDSPRTAEQQAADWLILLREEPESASLQGRFETWLDDDPLHACAWVAVSESFETIFEVGPELDGQWREVAIAPLRAPRRRWRQRSPGRLAAIRPGRLVVGAVAAALALWFAPAAVLHLQSDYVTGPGELRGVTLADGSTVNLGPGSALAVSYSDKARSVRLLAGEAWFDVVHNPAAPFRVIAGDVRTTVLGTSFDVRRVGSATAVSLKRGRVRVTTEGTARDLSPGQWVRIDEAHRVEAGADDPALLGAWQGGAIIARNRRVAEVIDELRPWFGGRIVLLNRALGGSRIDGVFNAREPESALAAMVARAGGKVQRITPWIILIS